MRRKLLTIIMIPVVLIVLIVSYFNLIAPISIRVNNVECINWDATYAAVAGFEENYKNGVYDKNTTVIHSFNGVVPSDDEEDYLSVYINFDVTNRSFFEDFIIDGVVEKIETYPEMALFSFTSSDVETNIAWKHSKAGATILIDLFVGDYSDQEIVEFIKGLTIKMVGDGEFFGQREMKIELKDVENIIIKR